ncbi:hypothetical protein O0I10_003823 [Lichtheimia ornata]|uniref:C2H2-type domain-containing protein n=1 Tax=Lichtheimia ornata TaxID=688661 RepID=A0AAD7Y0S3_9FUNG|nr:uncharacterized protein O0I10_003823 [Lichtheimia ornata]KAJ8660366.1 hypothetical protein O0I10_003823 [Lichtheimia ornata]
MYPISTPYGSFPTTTATTNAITALDATAAHLTLPNIVQDNSPISELPCVSATVQQSTTQSRILPTPEELDCYVVAHVTQVVKQHCIHQGGLENTELVFQITSWTINSITDDHFLRKYYYLLVIHQLYTHYKQGDDLPQISSPTEITTPPLSTSSTSSQLSEAASSPFTCSDVSSNNGSIPRTACDYCQRTFSRKDALRRHLKRTCTYTKEHTSLHVFSVAD